MKQQINLAPQCYYCGRFALWEDVITCAGIGSIADLEPPDDIYIHKECAKKEKVRYGSLQSPSTANVS